MNTLAKNENLKIERLRSPERNGTLLRFANGSSNRTLDGTRLGAGCTCGGSASCAHHFQCVGAPKERHEHDHEQFEQLHLRRCGLLELRTILFQF